MYDVLLSDSARAFFENAAASLQRRLDRCFDHLRNEPRRHRHIIALKGSLAGYYRYRVGDYRVVYSIKDDERVVIVATIADRKDVYRP